MRMRNTDKIMENLWKMESLNCALQVGLIHYVRIYSSSLSSYNGTVYKRVPRLFIKVVDTHPTGMHSCVICLYEGLAIMIWFLL